jgi:adenosylcobinamide-phosphate synthase
VFTPSTHVQAMTALLMTLAVALDWLLGEPRRWHPLAGFARLAAWLEQRIYAPDRWRGVFAAAVLLLPATLLAAELAELPDLWGPAFSLLALVFALGHKRLHDQVHRIVSSAENREIVPACESVLESGNDGVFGALFWFLVAGAPGAVLYRLASALDALWGCKNPRNPEFGWAVANLDDMLNIVPARLTALTYALLGHTRQALDCWREQAPTWDDPNAGPVLAAAAGALGIRLGGPARHEGEWRERPQLGSGAEPEVADIGRALALVRKGVLLWLLVIALGAAGWGWLRLSDWDWLAAALERILS